MDSRVDVSREGTVRLGCGVVADGADHEATVRVQSHVHSDHLSGFDESKGTGRIVCSKATHALLVAMRGADLAYRSNFISIEYDEPFFIDDPSGGRASIRLLPSGHMVGAAQVSVTSADGYSVGYSGDFAMPLEKVMHVDELVLDATYGNPDYSRRRYTQQQAEERFVDEALRRSKLGPLIVYAHRGTLQRAIALLDDVCKLPLLGSAGQRAESAVHAEFGYVQSALIDPTSESGRDARKAGRYIEFVGTGDAQREMSPGEHKIKLSASISQMGDPFLEITSNYCRIAITDHADFDGTMEYVEAVSPSLVVTDASRSPGHAVALAAAIKATLGIEAYARPPQFSIA